MNECEHGIENGLTRCEKCFQEGYSSKIERLNEPIQTVKKICSECDEKYDIGNKCPNEPHTAIHRYRKLLKQVEECRKKEDELTAEMDSVWELLSEKETELLNKESVMKYSKGLNHKYDDSVEKIFPLTQEDVDNIINVSTDKLTDIMKNQKNLEPEMKEIINKNFMDMM